MVCFKTSRSRIESAPPPVARSTKGACPFGNDSIRYHHYCLVLNAGTVVGVIQVLETVRRPSKTLQFLSPRGTSQPKALRRDRGPCHNHHLLEVGIVQQ